MISLYFIKKQLSLNLYQNTTSEETTLAKSDLSALTSRSFDKSLRVSRFYVGLFHYTPKICHSLLKGGEKNTFFTCGNFFFASVVLGLEISSSSSSSPVTLSLSQDRLILYIPRLLLCPSPPTGWTEKQTHKIPQSQ